MIRRKSFILGNGATLSYAEYGDPKGFPLLLMHGLAGSVVAEGMEDSFKDLPLRVIALARPGYGESSLFEMGRVLDWAKELLPFLDALQLHKFDVLAHSAGAPYGYSLAAAYPERVRGLYLNGGIPALYKQDVLACYGEEAKALRVSWNAASYEELAKLLCEMFFSNLPPAFAQSAMVLDSKANGGLGMAREIKLQSLHWGFDIEDIAAPITAIHSRTDTEAPFAAAEKNASYLQHVSFVVLEQGGHCDDDSIALAMKLVLENQ